MTTESDIHNLVLSSAVAPNTRLAYRKGWSCFTDYCRREQVTDPLSASPETVARFLLDCATRPRSGSGLPLSMGTVFLYSSAVARRFADANRPSPTHHPTVRATLKGLSRLAGAVPRRVKALREGHVSAMIARCPDSVIGLRDAAVVALGFAGALRRSELCALHVDDVAIIPSTPPHPRRMLLTIRRSKTDQTGRGQTIAIPEGKTVKPIDRVQAWLSVSGITQGPLFRTMRRGGAVQDKPLHHSDIPRLVKRYGALIGLDPRELSGHSLRAGFVTSAAAHHARLDKIMAVTRHTSTDTVMNYIRDADAFSDHAGNAFL
ncbi:MAG: site-specific integrase [Deltaproteobacteria bacterium]|nr:site-specific integrase [Deltaproteobacteria bacterium]